MIAPLAKFKRFPLRKFARLNHAKRIARLAELGSAGQDIIGLFEQQEENARATSGMIPSVPILKMGSITWMHDAADFSDFIHAARLEMPDSSPLDVLHVEVHFSDEREPNMPPVRMAATLRLGEILEGDEE